MATGTTAIRAPTDDLSNHTIVLRQLKEAVEVGQRLRGDPTDSFVQVSELVSAGIARFTNNTVQSPVSTDQYVGGFSGLPSSTGVGTRAVITDASVASASIGDAAAGGGTNTMPVFWNGTQWQYG